MFEKVNPSHPDKIADRIAGAIVDYAYSQNDNPKIAVEVLVGHGECNIIAETSVHIELEIITSIINRIVGNNIIINYNEVEQDIHLANNQIGAIRCGDNGIFKGVPVSMEQIDLTEIVKDLYKQYPYDGKFIINNNKLTICQSNALTNKLKYDFPTSIINPLGDWVGGINVDSGATNRKLGSDMGDSVTGGGIHGKDCSKADVSINIYAFLKAQKENKIINLSCAIGDEYVDGKPYNEIVQIAKDYIGSLGGFEKFAEWGLIR